MRVSRNSIRTSISFVAGVKPEGALDFAIYERKATQIDDTHFVIKHLNDSSKDHKLRMIEDVDG